MDSVGVGVVGGVVVDGVVGVLLPHPLAKNAVRQGVRKDLRKNRSVLVAVSFIE
jgi:hypothetical protein